MKMEWYWHCAPFMFWLLNNVNILLVLKILNLKEIWDMILLRWASQVAQWWRACLPMQEMQIQSLGWENPWSSKWQPIPVFLPGKSHGQRSLVGYSPWSHKDGHVEGLSTHAQCKHVSATLWTHPLSSSPSVCLFSYVCTSSPSLQVGSSGPFFLDSVNKQ